MRSFASRALFNPLSNEKRATCKSPGAIAGSKLSAFAPSRRRNIATRSLSFTTGGLLSDPIDRMTSNIWVTDTLETDIGGEVVASGFHLSAVKDAVSSFECPGRILDCKGMSKLSPPPVVAESGLETAEDRTVLRRSFGTSLSFSSSKDCSVVSPSVHFLPSSSLSFRSTTSGSRMKRSVSHSSTEERNIIVSISSEDSSPTGFSIKRKSTISLASSEAIAAAAAAAAASAALWAFLRAASRAAAFLLSSRSSGLLLMEGEAF
mmetsp:Transcript_61894/g.130692  ORF Transcript_61894/g.130692 Transcript_61894/m.130692 type:complete len:263 (-) Transcript_61894:389-1177(-)